MKLYISNVLIKINKVVNFIEGRMKMSNPRLIKATV